MPTQVKVCGITREQDAQDALTLHADFIGLNLWPQTPRCVAEDQLPSLFSVIPQARRVMVDVCPALEKLKAHADHFAFFQIHFPFDTTEETIHAWADVVGAHRLWLAPKCPPNTPFPQKLLDIAQTFLIDAYKKDAFGGTGHTANWERFVELRTQHSDKQWILAGGLSPKNIEQAVTQSQTDFVDINSGVESAPGIKDRAKLHRLMKTLGRVAQ